MPRGWETYVYGRAAISAPSTWAVRRNQNCPNTSAPGTLLLGLPTVLDHCAEHHSPPNVVMLNSVPTGSERQPAACQRLERFNGLPVFVTPCAPGGDPSGEVLWSVPTLGAQVQARGSGSIAVIHTLRKASPTPSAVSASGPLRVRITVARTRVPAGTPIRGVALITNSSTPVTVEACAADGWFDVGLSNGDLSSSPVSSGIACRPSVRLATGVSRVPFTVATSYPWCAEEGHATPGDPRCTTKGPPPPPAGSYRTTVVMTGLPAGTPKPRPVTVSLEAR